MSAGPPPHRPPAAPLIRSFWMGGYEGADHISGNGLVLDMVQGTDHLARLDEDHAMASRRGLRTVRESIGWRLAEAGPGCWDFERTLAIAQSARRHGLQVVWTLMHYGTPPDVNLLDDAFIPRLVAFAEAVARVLRPWHEGPEPPVYNIVNEIGFVAWVVSATNVMHPYRGETEGQGDSSVQAGYVVKRRLVRAVLLAMAAMRRVDARARFLHVEPVIHTVPPPGRPDLEPLALQIAGYQWQAWDLIAGRMEPELGGSLQALDIVGVNHYHSSQWEVLTEDRLRWHEQDPRRRPVAALLADVWQRYRRPLLVAETSHVGVGRADWLHDMAGEVRAAREQGVPVAGLCLYPLVDRHDWSDPTHWHRSGLWDTPAAAGGNFARSLRSDYAQALALWQRHLPDEPENGAPMNTLIVFSHLRWNFVYQRPQHLMSRLARHYRVLFVEEPVHRQGPPQLAVVSKGPNLQVLVPYTPVESPGFHDEQLSLLQPMLAAHLAAQGISDYVAWFYTPMALPLISQLQPQLQPQRVIYDCMDELASFKDAPRQLRQRESALMSMASLVFTGGPSLYAARRQLHPQVHCLPSSVDAAHFSPANCIDDCAEALAAHELQGALARPRLGYFGVIDERMDLELVEAVARARPEWQLVMAGPVVKIDPARLPHLPNIHWLGMQPYERLPHLLQGWDVCLMPFALNEATRCISPTKTLEYMAGGKPVVSTAVRDVIDLYGDAVLIGHDTAGFIAACDTILAEAPEAQALRAATGARTVEASSWDRVAAEMARLIDAAILDSDTAPWPRPSRVTPAALADVGSTRLQGVRGGQQLISGTGTGS